MKLSDIKASIEEDSKVDYTNLEQYILTIPRMVTKYINLRSDEKMLLNKIKIRYGELYKDKWLYYLGKGTPEQYREKPFNVKVLKSDVGVYMDADKDLLQLKGEIIVQEEKVKMLEDAIKTFQNINFTVKNYVDYMKMKSGTY